MLKDETLILYTTHCPKCKVIESKLASKHIEYREIEDVDIMRDLGIDTVPVLCLNDKMMNFTEANDYINNI